MDENNILFQIKSLEQLILRDFFRKIMCENHEIKKIPSPTQMRIIDYLTQNQNKKVYQKDLENIFNLRRATISEVLITMEKNNMIERVISKDDTRTKEIKLSEYSKKFFETSKKRILELEHVITKDIDNEDLKTFVNVINKMKENILNMSNEK